MAAGRPSTAAMTASPTVRASRPLKGTRMRNRLTRSTRVATAVLPSLPITVGRAEARYRDCSRSVSSTRPPHRTSVFPRIRRSTSSQGQAAAGVAVVLVHGVGMLLARQR